MSELVDNIYIIKKVFNMALADKNRVDIALYKRTSEFKHSEINKAVKQLLQEKDLKYIMIDKNNEYMEMR